MKSLGIEALFLGENGSEGYYKYNRYKLRVSGDTIERLDGTGRVVYGSTQAFLENWVSINHYQV